MNQLSFLPTARARKTDPVTSKEAAQDPTLNRQLGEMLEVLERWPGRTASEYQQMILCCAHKRLPELADLGFAEKGAIRPCKVTGRKAHTWWPRVPEAA